MGWIWPAGQSLPTPVLDEGLQGFREPREIQSSVLYVWALLGFPGESSPQQILEGVATSLLS